MNYSKPADVVVLAAFREDICLLSIEPAVEIPCEM